MILTHHISYNQRHQVWYCSNKRKGHKNGVTAVSVCLSVHATHTFSDTGELSISAPNCRITLLLDFLISMHSVVMTAATPTIRSAARPADTEAVVSVVPGLLLSVPSGSEAAEQLIF